MSQSIDPRPELPKRFYAGVAVAEGEGGHAILLDGRPVKTPARRPLAIRSRAVADAVAAEWDAQQERIDPATMPVTRLVNTVVDAIADDPAPVRDDVARYAETDLLFYRAADPARLVERQRERWDPILEWAHRSIGARFLLAEGVMHVAQPEPSLRAVAARLAAIDDPFAVAAMHQVTTLTGSALLALALADGHVSAEEAWSLAHLDEDWNIEQWGADAETEARRQLRWEEMQAAALVLAAR
ncbi:ATP12 family chaperone protein [Aurantimonas sp. HBX-1]|uniref:ATP12 family chaperone protein n=1 Tax=Aurantimonas sp. HBX-1 TaxID=2906072 RepID=UPI001F2D49BB|nr:ATP12 family protein [Aurantimonas sp. HBX-1]UIJ73800.1 ATPase [Aurantimonas sp. HBX-1]